MTTVGDRLYERGGIPVGGGSLLAPKESLVCRSGNYEPYKYWSSTDGGNVYTTITDGFNVLTSGRNDRILLSPDNHTLSSEFTWDKNMTHLIGMFPSAMMNQRARIGQDAAMASMFNVTGYGNEFRNIYTMWGNGESTSYAGFKVTGDRNIFYNCHFAGPLSLTEAAIVHTTNAGGALHLNGCEECYFKNCVIGTDTIERAANNVILYIGGTAADTTKRNIFEDCLFLSSSDSGQDALNIYIGQYVHGWVLFKNCTFINIAADGFSNALPIAVTINGNVTTTQFRVLFDSKCCFHGYTDIVAAGDEANVEVQVVPVPQDTTKNEEAYMLAANPDVST